MVCLVHLGRGDVLAGLRVLRALTHEVDEAGGRRLEGVRVRVRARARTMARARARVRGGRRLEDVGCLLPNVGGDDA